MSASKILTKSIYNHQYEDSHKFYDIYISLPGKISMQQVLRESGQDNDERGLRPAVGQSPPERARLLTSRPSRKILVHPKTRCPDEVRSMLPECPESRICAMQNVPYLKRFDPHRNELWD